MAKVILITMLLLLAALVAGGEPVVTTTPGYPRTALAQEFEWDGGWASFPERHPIGHLQTSTAPLTGWSAFDSLTLHNHLDVAEPSSPLATNEADRQADAVLQAAEPIQAVVSDWGWENLAALSSASNELRRPQRPQGRIGRERKLWPHERPLRKAQVWLARKQP